MVRTRAYLKKIYCDAEDMLQIRRLGDSLASGHEKSCSASKMTGVVTPAGARGAQERKAEAVLLRPGGHAADQPLRERALHALDSPPVWAPRIPAAAEG